MGRYLCYWLTTEALQYHALARPDKDVMETKINRPQVNLKKLYKWTLKESPNNSITEDLTYREISYCFTSKQPRVHLPVHWIYLKELAEDAGNPKYCHEYFSVQQQLLGQVNLCRNISQLLSCSSPCCNPSKISHPSFCFLICIPCCFAGAPQALSWASSKWFSSLM